MIFDTYNDKGVACEELGLGTPLETTMELYAVGTKFHRLGDKRPWYVVAFINDTVKRKNGDSETLIVIKTWNVHSQCWTHKIFTIHFFLDEQSCMHEHYSKKEGHGKIIPLSKIMNKFE